MPMQDNWEDWLEAWSFSVHEDSLEGMTEEELADFEHSVAELWHIGFLEGGPDSQEARDAFFELAEAFGFDVMHFDWDEWRDWYDN